MIILTQKSKKKQLSSILKYFAKYLWSVIKQLKSKTFFKPVSYFLGQIWGIFPI